MPSVARIADSPAAEPSPAFRGVARDMRNHLTAWAERRGPIIEKIATDTTTAWHRRATPLPARELERIAARWRACGTDEAGLSQSNSLDRHTLTIIDVRFVPSSAHRRPDPRMPALSR